MDTALLPDARVQGGLRVNVDLFSTVLPQRPVQCLADIFCFSCHCNKSLRLLA